jgi:hypothetical protein
MLFIWYEREGEYFLKCLITRDESYMHFFTLANKCASSEWWHRNLPQPKKVCSQTSSNMLFHSVFWKNEGVIAEHYLEQRQAINSER